MGDLQHIGDVEWAVLGTARLVHDLGVHVACRGHDDDDVLPLFIEEERSVPDLGAREQKVVHGTEGVHRQVVDLDQKGKQR